MTEVYKTETNDALEGISYNDLLDDYINKPSEKSLEFIKKIGLDKIIVHYMNIESKKGGTQSIMQNILDYWFVDDKIDVLKDLVQYLESAPNLKDFLLPAIYSTLFLNKRFQICLVKKFNLYLEYLLPKFINDFDTENMNKLITKLLFFYAVSDCQKCGEFLEKYITPKITLPDNDMSNEVSLIYSLLNNKKLESSSVDSDLVGIALEKINRSMVLLHNGNIGVGNFNAQLLIDDLIKKHQFSKEEVKNNFRIMLANNIITFFSSEICIDIVKFDYLEMDEKEILNLAEVMIFLFKEEKNAVIRLGNTGQNILTYQILPQKQEKLFEEIKVEKENLDFVKKEIENLSHSMKKQTINLSAIVSLIVTILPFITINTAFVGKDVLMKTILAVNGSLLIIVGIVFSLLQLIFKPIEPKTKCSRIILFALLVVTILIGIGMIITGVLYYRIAL